MRLSVSEMAALSGVSVRTLHYYDEIGLLRPDEVAGSGYRYYGRQSAERLQQILFYRELDFPLRQICLLLDTPDFDETEALRQQRHLLMLKRERLDRLVELLDARLKGEKTMNFEGFSTEELERTRAAYAAEAKQRWRQTAAWQQSEKKKRSKEEQAAVDEAANAIFRRFAALRDRKPEDNEVQQTVADWQTFLNEQYYTCTREILAGLGSMYTADERFQKNLDRFGEGTAALMSAAIAVYCQV